MFSLSAILPQNINSLGFRTVNKVRKACGVKCLKDYKLSIRQDNVPVINFDTDIYKPPKEAATYNYVKVGKKSDKSFSREIISFYDKNKKLIHRYFRENGVNIKRKVYSEGFDSREITTSEYIPSQKFLNYGLWKDRSKEYQQVNEYRHPALSKDGKHAKDMRTKRIDYEECGDNQVQKITYTKYPLTLGFQNASQKEVVSGRIKKTGDEFVLSDIKSSDNVTIDTQDEFLTVRFLDPRSDEGADVLTKYFLKLKGLEKLDVAVKSVNYPMGTKVADFNQYNGVITFYEPYKKGFWFTPIDASGHEVEHAYQYAQIGRIGKGDTAYETRAMQVLGTPSDIDEICEATEYAIANDIYPRENIVPSNPLYWDNYLEVKARAAGEKAVDLYKNNSNNIFFEKFNFVEF